MFYKELKVWQKSHSLTLNTIKAVDQLGRSHAADIIARQLIRANTSIGANIAEGYGRHKGREYIRFLEIAYGSANEAENWLSVLRDAKLMKEPVASELISENAEVIKMLATMIRTLENKIS